MNLSITMILVFFGASLTLLIPAYLAIWVMGDRDRFAQRFNIHKMDRMDLFASVKLKEKLYQFLVIDISRTGMAILIPKDIARQVKIDRHLKIYMDLGSDFSEPMLLESQLVYCRVRDNGDLRIGVEFDHQIDQITLMTVLDNDLNHENFRMVS